MRVWVVLVLMLVVGCTDTPASTSPAVQITQEPQTTETPETETPEQIEWIEFNRGDENPFFTILFMAQLIEFGDDIVYVEREGEEGKKSYIVSGGEELGRQYDMVSQPYEMNGKLGYGAGKGNKTISVYDGKELGRHYDGLGASVDVGGKVTFRARLDETWFVVSDGIETEVDYDGIVSITDVSGELAYIGIKGNDTFIIVGDQTLGPFDKEENYDKHVRSLMSSPGGQLPIIKEVDGKLAYAVLKGGEIFVYFDDEEFGPFEYYAKKMADLEFKIPPTLADINGKLAFDAIKDGEQFVYYDGRELGPYDPNHILIPETEVDGKLAFVAKKDYRYFLVLDGEETRLDYDYVDDLALMVIDGKLTFEVREGGMLGNTSIIQDLQELDHPYDSICCTEKVGDKLAFRAWVGDDDIIIYDGQEIVPKYDVVYLTSAGDRLVYQGSDEDGNTIIAIEKQ